MLTMLLIGAGVLAASVMGFGLIEDALADHGGGSDESDDSETPIEEAPTRTNFADLVEGADPGTLSEGTENNNRMLGDDDPDVMFGDGGDDTLRGRGGTDLLVDSEGADRMYGGADDDLLIASNVVDPDELQAFLTNLPEDTSDIGAAFIANVTVDAGEDADLEGDIARGGTGDDVIIAGSNDTVSGGDGADTFQAGEWITADQPLLIEDFDPTADILDFYSDDPANLSLNVQDVDDGAGGSDAHVYNDNQLVIVVRGMGGALSVADINVTGPLMS